MDEIISAVKVCRQTGNASLAKDLFLQMHHHGLESCRKVGKWLATALINSGNVSDAHRLLMKMDCCTSSQMNLVSLIKGYVQVGEFEHALNLFDTTRELNSFHSERHLMQALLKSCAAVKSIDKGLELHDEIIKAGLETHESVVTTLISFYVRVCLFNEALLVFHRFGEDCIISWNALVAGMAECSTGEEALECFEDMLVHGENPNSVTCTCVLKACASIQSLQKGQVIHSLVVSEGFEQNPFVGNSLIDMYGKCGSLIEADKVFSNLQGRNEVSWNALTTGCFEDGDVYKVWNCLERMLEDGRSPTTVILMYTLKACSKMCSIDRGQGIHCHVVKLGFERVAILSNTVMEMYAKCGLVAEASYVLSMVKSDNIVLWNALITGCVDQGHGDIALEFFEEMQIKGLCPDNVTFLSILRWCAVTGCINKGLGVHSEIIKQGFETDSLIGNCLVDMYGKCGALGEAANTFNLLKERDGISWSLIIAACACQGESGDVFKLFDRMCNSNNQPDGITVLNVLSVCSRDGLVDEGVGIFCLIWKEIGLYSTAEHYNSLTDLLSRAGQLCEAHFLLENMAFHPDVVAWNILLGACQRGENIGLGRKAFDSVVELNIEKSEPFITMSKIYADAQMWEEAKLIDAMRTKL